MCARARMRAFQSIYSIKHSHLRVPKNDGEMENVHIILFEVGVASNGKQVGHHPCMIRQSGLPHRSRQFFRVIGNLMFFVPLESLSLGLIVARSRSVGRGTSDLHQDPGCSA